MMSGGRILGDYEVIKQIGQGALGTVFLAEHRFMKRQYMLKVLPEELAGDRAFIQRFQEEVGVLSALEHSHIVKIHNVSFSNGLYFLVSDCAVDEMGETTNLAQYLAAHQDPLSEEEVFGILRQVGEALDYAHSKKVGDIEIVHRGLKLNNILVSRGALSVSVHLCDFGLSAIVGDGAVLTRTYKVVAETLGIADFVCGSKTDPERYPCPAVESGKQGALQLSFLQSFAFLAPEQKHLDNETPITSKSDVYSFGVLAYYLLTRSLPEGYFAMPSEIRPGCSWDWDGLLRMCLASDPHKRPDGIVAALDMIKDPRQGVTVATVTAATTVTTSTPTASAVEEPRETPHPLAEGVQVKTPELAPTAEPVFQPAGQLAMAATSSQGAASASEASSASSTMEAEAPQPVLSTSQLQRPELDHDPAQALQIDPTVKQYQPEVKDVTDVEPMQTEMVVVEGGTFARGSTDGNRDEMPCHKVTVPSFAIDVHPVINEQFVLFLEVMGGEKDHNHQDLLKLKESRIKRLAGKLSIESGYAKHPVVGVTWYGAAAYAKWVGKRLPTEAEWEIASYGELDNVLYPTGDDIEKSQANFFSSDTTVVKSYGDNDYGLYDMAGNVYEWCYDWYGYNYYETSVQEPDNPRGPVQGVYRVLRGGCWKSLKEDLRCSRRHRNNPGTANSTYGFRCTTDAQ